MAPSKEDRYVVLQRLSNAENGVLGVIAGAVEAVATQPLTFVKNARQQGWRIPLNPRVLYRGVTVSAANDGTITGVQFFFTGMIQKGLTGGSERKLWFIEELASSLASGGISGIPCALMELIMIQQQRFGTTLLSTPLRVVQTTGSALSLFRGTVAAVCRESVATAGYLGVCPSLSALLLTSPMTAPYLADNTFISNAVASTASGVAAATLSHPFDTIKSCMQGDLEQQRYKTFSQTAREIYVTKGMPAFFLGLQARAATVIMCFFIFNEAKLQFAPYMAPSKF